MKIGIITQPLSNNYGGLLQNYALQQILERLGHEAITLDQFQPKLSLWRLYMVYVKTFFLKLIGKGEKRNYPYILTEKEEAYINYHMHLFTENSIHYTKKMSQQVDFLKCTNDLGLRALIVGSDQVWRPKYNKNIYCSFLDFAQNLDVKRIAYAASFGVDEWEYTTEQTSQCKKLLSSFDAVSVRENSAVGLCQKYFSRSACCVLDPTMLLDANDYIDMVESVEVSISEGDIFTYILDETEIKSEIIEAVESKLHLKSFSILPKKVDALTAKNIESCVFPSPIKWLRAFMDAKFVVCDSFHGAVFSIIFNKPFIVVVNEQRGRARFTSLLEMFSLTERMVTGISDLSVVTQSIDWDAINGKRERLKQDSISFLQRSLD